MLIPDENVKDLAEIPDNIKEKLDIRSVKWIDEVIQHALTSIPAPLPAPEEKPAPEIVDEKPARKGVRPKSQVRPH